MNNHALLPLGRRVGKTIHPAPWPCHNPRCMPKAEAMRSGIHGNDCRPCSDCICRGMAGVVVDPFVGERLAVL